MDFFILHFNWRTRKGGLENSPVDYFPDAARRVQQEIIYEQNKTNVFKNEDSFLYCETIKKYF